MRILTSPWEVAEAGINTVRIDEAVLDQILLGNFAVYTEVQALQDLNVMVEVTDSADVGSKDAAPDLVVLRHTLGEQMELEHATAAIAAIANRTTALWSLASTASERGAAAATGGFDLYEPEIIIVPLTQPLTRREALRLARGIGALR